MSERRKMVGVALGAVLVAALMLWFRGSKQEAAVWHPWDGPTVQRDWDTIRHDTLRFLVLRDALVWEERQRATSGFEFELLERFARKSKMPFIVRSFDHPDSLLAALWRGDGDVGAMQATPTSAWKDHFHTTVPFAQVRPVVVKQRTDALVPDTVAAVKANVDSLPLSIASPFAKKDYRFAHALGTPVAAPVLGTEDDLLLSVVLGERTAAVISDMRAGHEAARFPVLEFGAPMGEELPLCFVVRASSPRLLEAMDAWLRTPKEQDACKQLLRAYVDELPDPGPLRSRKAKGLAGDSISPFDAHFQVHAAVGGWDWQLLAAMAWKETRFDSTVTSRKGAMGIMQFMPGTAERMGLDSTSSMADHIEAAARYLSRLDTLWMRAVPDKQQRLRFVLASYNAGPGHIIDAQRLAEQLGLDPAKWEGHVERAVLLLAKPRFFLRPGMKNGYCKGNQVFHYVRGVLTVYHQLKAKRR